MAHARLVALLVASVAICALVLAGCTRPAQPVTPPPQGSAGAPAESPPPTSGWEGGAWGRFHSRRHDLWLPLPDGAAWKIDDHGTSWLVAKHPASSSTLRLRMFREDHAVNKAKCEALGRAAEPALPKELEGRLVDASDNVLPGWDGHGFSVVAATRPRPAPPGGAAPPPVLVGQYLGVAANIRRCLVVHFATQAPTGSEAVIGARLADVLEIVRRIQVEDDLAGPTRTPPP